MNHTLRFLIVLVVSLVITFLSQNWILDGKYTIILFKTYTANFLLAITLYFGLLILQKKTKGLMGFVFMVGSLVKFAVFFIFFMPAFKEDGDMSKVEFGCFFVPYVLCLIAEVGSLVKFLNRS